jgi:hypothetical protein
MKVRPVVAVVAAGLVFACLPALASAAYNVSWSAWDLSSVVGDTAIAGRPAPFRDPGNGQQLIFANTPSGKLVEFDRSPDGHWKPYDISAMAKSTLNAGDPVPVIDPQTHHLLAVADSPSGDLVQFDRSPNGSWAPYNLTNDVGRKTIVGNPVPIVDPQSNDLLVVAPGDRGSPPAMGPRQDDVRVARLRPDQQRGRDDRR